MSSDFPPQQSLAEGQDVTRAHLEEMLARVSASVTDPVAGLFGPDSKVWEITKEACCFVGAGRAALLQLAHPFVSWGIYHHSTTKNAPYQRFQRTFHYVFRMMYGDLPTVRHAARSVHSIHTTIQGPIEHSTGPLPSGTPYKANDSKALLWVFATLIDTTLLCYDSILRPLPIEEKNQFYLEFKRFAYLFGIDDNTLPANWLEFSAYMNQMFDSDLLTVSQPGREMGRFLMESLIPFPTLPLKHYAELTAWLLPERLANDFGLDRGGNQGRLRFHKTLLFLHKIWPWLPDRIRYLPPYIEANRRLAGQTDRDRLGEFLNRLWVGHSTMKE